MRRLTSVAIALVVALALGGGATSAKKPVTEFDVHVGDAFILSIGLPAVDIAGASNGDTIELLFTGQIDSKHSKAEGDGGFQHFDKSGKLVDFGTFTAKRLISFLDLGPAAGDPPSFHRGRAKILVRAVGQTGGFDATLAVDCKFGPAPPPPPDFEEGTFFAIAGGLNFNETVNEDHVFNLFVAVSEDQPIRSGNIRGNLYCGTGDPPERYRREQTNVSQKRANGSCCFAGGGDRPGSR